MRLLNIDTFKLERYDDEWIIPPYVTLSHRWGEEEVLFEDLQELPHEQEVRDLRRNYNDLERRFNNLQRQLDGEMHASRETQHLNAQQGSFAGSQHKTKEDEDCTNDSNSADSHLRHMRLKKKGWNKINGCCKEAKAFGFSYVWIDTCCINKDSSSELSESINSMFSWYRNASLCIAYLSDVSSKSGMDEFTRSTWFSRGWTLQELIAPNDVWFYNKDWGFLGLRSALAPKIASITLISSAVLQKNSQGIIDSFSVAARLSWAALRKTTRPEDRAYSLLGMFCVNMPTIYGEGEQAAFFRLQVEIFKAVPDHSIFAWNFLFDEGKGNFYDEINIFAPRVDYFLTARSIVSTPYHSNSSIPQDLLVSKPTPGYSRFSHGICIPLLLGPTEFHSRTEFRVCLGCKVRGSDRAIAIELREYEPGHFVRLPSDIHEVDFSVLNNGVWSLRDVYVSNLSVNLGQSWQRSTSQRGFQKARLNDDQILGAGFERIKCSWKMSTSSQNHFRDDFILDLFDTITESGEFELPHPFQIGALMYRSKDTKSLFGVVFSFTYEAVLAAVVDHFKPEMSFYSVYPPFADSEEFWEDLSARVISKSLQSGWNVFVFNDHSAVGTLQLNMRVKSSTLLELNLDNRIEEDKFTLAPVRILLRRPSSVRSVDPSEPSSPSESTD